MGLHRVAQVPEHLVDVFLLGSQLASRPLELNEQRATSWDEEHAVRPTGLPLDVELEVPHPQLQRLAADLLLDR